MKCPKCGANVKDGASFCPKCGNKLPSGSSKTPFQIFKEGYSNYRKYNDGTDLFIYPIPESIRSLVRPYFGIERNEEILIVRDTTTGIFFRDPLKQGLVLTDKGIHVIVDSSNINEDTTINWTWDIISRVEYQELCLYFYDYDGNNAPIHISYFLADISDDRDIARIGRFLSSLFTQMAKSVEPQASDFDRWNEEIGALVEKHKYTEAISRLRQCAIDQPENASAWDEWLGRVYYFCLEDYSNAITAFRNALNEADPENTEWVANIAYRLYNAYYSLSKHTNTEFDLNEVRKLALYAAINGNDKEIVYTSDAGENKTLKQDATSDFYTIDAMFKEKFFERPYNQRKILLPVKQYTDLTQETLNVISVDNLPEIDFPIGHPVANQLYIGHPYLPHKYLPFENYQLELIEDKVREFCSLAQKLGATEITIECLNTSSSDGTVSGNMSGNASGQHKVVEGNVSGRLEYSRHLIEELTHSINMHQTFTPTQAPILPEGMVWYANEPSWQRLYAQRMEGSLLTHEERIETRKSQMVESSEMKEIKGELKSLFTSAGLEWSKTEEAKYQMQENAILSIKVKFAPMKQLTGELAQQQLIEPAIEETLQLTGEEQEYLDEVKECLADAELGGSERRLLNKLRIKLGISEVRAAELEESLHKPQLTEAEKEYLEAYEDALEDGVISEKERRLLDKLMKINDISAERASEIEKMIGNK